MDTRLLFENGNDTNEAIELLDGAGINYEFLDENRVLVTGIDIDEITELLDESGIKFDTI